MIDTKKYEAMAKLRLSDAEREYIAVEIEQLRRGVENTLSSIDLDGIEPLVTVLDIKNVLREDKSEKLISREELLSTAIEEREGYYVVPRTLD